jgi:hypothetical protein
MTSRSPVLLLLISGGICSGDPLAVATRTDRIQAARLAKAETLRPERLPTLHRLFLRFQESRVVERFTTGTYRVKAGGLGPGSGFALGTEYFRAPSHSKGTAFRALVGASSNEFYKAETQMTLQSLFGGFLSLDLGSGYQRSPRIDYYGPGPDSARSGRTAYALEGTGLAMHATLRPRERFRWGALTRYLLFNVGPAGHSRLASTDRAFTPATTPGLDVQSNFLQAGAFAEYDSRRYDAGRPDGGWYRIELSRLSDRTLRLHSFERIDGKLQHHFAFLNGQREIALRAKTVLSVPRGSGGVPFYLQPMLGGANDLRGFRARRFYDDNLVVLNAEYRWEVARGADAALFLDAGRVFHHWRQPGLGDLETSYGFGFRIRGSDALLLRLDLGMSREGPQVWLTFEDVF